MTYQLVGAEGKVQRFVNSENKRQYRDVIKQVRWFDPSRALLDKGDLRIEHPLCTAKGLSDHISIADKAELRASVEVNISGSWVELSRSVKSAEDSAMREWMYNQLAIKFDEQGKWSFTFVAPASGTYRLRLNLAIAQRARVRTYTAKNGGALYQAKWGTLAFGWSDMTKDVSIATATDDGLEIISAPVTLRASEAHTWDPSFSDDADWGADIQDGGKYPDDGSDWCGGDSSHAVSTRVANRFDITTLPTTATVDQVDFQINVDTVTGASALLWDIDGYDGTGQGDPETDSSTTAYAKCGVAGVYVNDTISFRTTGSKTFTDLGATANSDVEAARDAGSTFCIAIRETTDIVTNNYTSFLEYTSADPPTLTITYTNAASSSILRQLMAHEGG